MLDMKHNFFSTFTLVLGRFFHRSGSEFFWIGSGFLVDPDSDSEKKLDPDPVKKTRIRNTGLKQCAFDLTPIFKIITAPAIRWPWSERPGSTGTRQLCTMPAALGAVSCRLGSSQVCTSWLPSCASRARCRLHLERAANTLLRLVTEDWRIL